MCLLSQVSPREVILARPDPLALESALCQPGLTASVQPGHVLPLRPCQLINQWAGVPISYARANQEPWEPQGGSPSTV